MFKGIQIHGNLTIHSQMPTHQIIVIIGIAMTKLHDKLQIDWHFKAQCCVQGL